MTFPKIRQTLDETSVRAARVDVTTFAALARAAAVRRGCRGVIHFAYGAQSAVWVTVCPRLAPGAGTVDTVASIDNLENRYSVSLTSTSDSLQFDPRGLELDNVTTVVTLSISTPPGSHCRESLLHEIGIAHVRTPVTL